ncbi:ATP-binding protein [Achromobacter deleyi]|uniref:ATP-binding protein n=1 Tax=Achromobacter deleyi TaxID=1353891 RepID=A0A7T4B782_9BURK|nr:ATP-binding protein [Achromobacter deleyi]QQB36991.1 ATP-binding protein [Achromobacter deleyi]
MAKKNGFKGSAAIGNSGIKKHFGNDELWAPLFELAWNGFDAGASFVAVTVVENEIHGVERVVVLDDGEGIEFATLDHTFGNFNDSSKKANLSLKGQHGRGRLAFHKLCANASWFTRFKSVDAVIEIAEPTIKDFEAWLIEEADQKQEVLTHGHGTLVELTQFTDVLPTQDELREKFAVEFGWYLAVHKEKRLYLNGSAVDVPRHEAFVQAISADDEAFEAQVIRWEQRPTSEKSYLYLLNSSGELVYKVLSSLNQKPNFFTSVCVKSSWADTFSQEQDLFNPEAHTPTSPVWRKFKAQLDRLGQSVYDEFLRFQAEEVVQGYEDEGYFPTYAGLDEAEKAWRHQHTRDLVRNIYIAEPRVFQTASKKQAKLIIRLLDRLAVSNENEALCDVLEGALDLDANSVQDLANQLKNATFENIVASIEILQRRATAVEQLRHVMNVHYRKVLETPDLQKVIESNTWLFGPRYETLGAEEDTFTEIARKMRDEVMARNPVDMDDVDDEEDLPGAKRQTDLFLARKFPSLDSMGNRVFKCIVVEIKRPAISLNKKHLRQLEDYAEIIKRQPQFKSEKMHFELILLGRQISSSDTIITSRLNAHVLRNDPGLVTEDPRMKLYVMNWYTLLDGFELMHGFMLEKLKLKRDDYSAATREELVAELQTEH